MGEPGGQFTDAESDRPGALRHPSDLQHFRHPPSLPPSATLNLGEAAERISYVSCAALAVAVDRWLLPVGLRTTIKWPNDLCVEGRKLAGLLIERVDAFFIVGVGINVGLTRQASSDEIRDMATSLSQCGVEVDRRALLVDLVRELEVAMKETDPGRCRDVWRQKCLAWGREVRLICDGVTTRGRVIDIDQRMGLVVQRRDGEVVRLRGERTTGA